MRQRAGARAEARGVQLCVWSDRRSRPPERRWRQPRHLRLRERLSVSPSASPPPHIWRTNLRQTFRLSVAAHLLRPRGGSPPRSSHVVPPTLAQPAPHHHHHRHHTLPSPGSWATAASFADHFAVGIWPRPTLRRPPSQVGRRLGCPCNVFVGVRRQCRQWIDGLRGLLVEPRGGSPLQGQHLHRRARPYWRPTWDRAPGGVKTRSVPMSTYAQRTSRSTPSTTVAVLSPRTASCPPAPNRSGVAGRPARRPKGLAILAIGAQTRRSRG